MQAIYNSRDAEELKIILISSLFFFPTSFSGPISCYYVIFFLFSFLILCSKFSSPSPQPLSWYYDDFLPFDPSMMTYYNLQTVCFHEHFMCTFVTAWVGVGRGGWRDSVWFRYTFSAERSSMPCPTAVHVESHLCTFQLASTGSKRVHLIIQLFFFVRNRSLQSCRINLAFKVMIVRAFYTIRMLIQKATTYPFQMVIYCHRQERMRIVMWVRR